ncbi:MAG: cytochrome c oxidase assembly protein [Pseudomonadota bacterium]
MTDENKKVPGNSWLIAQLIGLAAGTFVFGFFVLPPLYDALCEVTGLGGKTNSEAVAVVESPDLTRTVTVEFVTTVNEYAPWKFRPTAASMEVHPGKLYTATFVAENLTAEALTGQAVPSVAPLRAATHFRKTECFCFVSQHFEATEAKEMPVRFMVSNALPKQVDTITLSYTFFRTDSVAQGQ